MEDFRKPLLFVAAFLAAPFPVVINVERKMQYSHDHESVTTFRDGEDKGAKAEGRLWAPHSVS